MSICQANVADIDSAIAVDVTLEVDLGIQGDGTITNNHGILTGDVICFANLHGVGSGFNAGERVHRMGSGQRNAKGRCSRSGREKLNGGLFRLLAEAYHHAADGNAGNFTQNGIFIILALRPVAVVQQCQHRAVGKLVGGFIGGAVNTVGLAVGKVIAVFDRNIAA